MTPAPASRQTPIHGRTLSLLALLALVTLTGAASSARAQSAWTDRGVSEHARERAPLALAARRSARRARANVRGRGLHPNPSVDWERQESFAPNAQGQDLFRLTVPFDLSGRRDTSRLLAELGAERSEVEAARVAMELAAQALTLFYRALAAERRVALLHHTQGVLDEAARVLTSRQSAGEASGYQRARLSLEAELARSRLARAALERSVTTRELAALLGADDAARSVSGDFHVAAPPPLDELVRRAAETRPELSSLQRRLTIARRASGAADTAWIPSFALIAGYNRQDGLQVGHGYAVGVRVDIPLFDRGQGERAAADAALGSLGDYAAALRRAVRGELGAARARLVGVLTERDRFGAATGAATELLLRAATVGFEGGERSLIELLDARRTALDVAERRLALDLAVRLADVELRRATGAL